MGGKVMRSPFTGGEVVRKSRVTTFRYRGEEFTVEREYYECVDTGLTFTDDELDQRMYDDVVSQYNQRHGI